MTPNRAVGVIDTELNRIYNEDCLGTNGMALIPDKSVDMILADLPYGTTACKWDTVIPFDALWAQYERVIKNNGAIVLTASQPFTSALVMSRPNLFRYEWIWCKSRALGFTHTKNAPMKKHESVLVFSKANIKHAGQPNRMNYNPQGLIFLGKTVNGDKSCKADKDGHRFARTSNKTYVQEYTNYPVSLLSFNNDGNTKHPTQKPVALFEYLIRTYTNPSETVLDNCIGSGTTAVAAINAGRNFIGFEMDAGYYDIANRRVQEAYAAQNGGEAA